MRVNQWNMRCIPVDSCTFLSIEQQDTPSSKPRETGCYNEYIILKFDSHLGSDDYNDVIMGAIKCQITSLTIVY